MSLSLKITPTQTPMQADVRQQLLTDIKFGHVRTEHMVLIPYDEDTGWGQSELLPYAPLQIDPAASVLHYGQSIFEGFKGYHQEDGSIKIFRPFENAKRFNASATRLAMPNLPVEHFVAVTDALVAQDRQWVPKGYGQSLYLRPIMIATEANIGLRPARSYQFILVASPADKYFKGGIKPISVWVTTEQTRASPGGTGAIKCAGNYAAGLKAQQYATSQGCDQVVFLDARTGENIEEMGGMNMFFVSQTSHGPTLLTPKLTDSILPGITRNSIIQVAKDLGYDVVERQIKLSEWIDGVQQGTISESFACGTAAVITPIGCIKSNAGEWTIDNKDGTPITMALRQHLLDLQHGRVKDPYGWMHESVGA